VRDSTRSLRGGGGVLPSPAEVADRLAVSMEQPMDDPAGRNFERARPSDLLRQ